MAIYNGFPDNEPSKDPMAYIDPNKTRRFEEKVPVNKKASDAITSFIRSLEREQGLIDIRIMNISIKEDIAQPETGPCMFIANVSARLLSPKFEGHESVVRAYAIEALKDLGYNPGTYTLDLKIEA